MSLYEELIKEARKNMLSLTLKQQKEIQKIYEGAIEELSMKAGKVKKESLTERWLLDYRDNLKGVERQLSDDVRRSIFKVINQSGQYAVAPDKEFLTAVFDKIEFDPGPHFTEMFSQVPVDILESIIKGDLYKDGKGLSKRIWNISNDFGDNIDYIIKRAMVEKKSAIALVKDLETFVKDPAKRPSNWGSCYPKLRSKQVDYNAQRLARTSITHGFRESQYRSAEKNPFVTAIHWSLSPEHYVRQVMRHGEDECDIYAKQNDYGLGRGNFPVDNVPLSHPQCLCSTYAVIVKSLDEVADELRDWVHGGSNTKLDQWYNEYGEYFATKAV
jgi:hypothetical protein